MGGQEILQRGSVWIAGKDGINKLARTRVFISSTFFDLRQIREDLERFIKSLGYEPVRFETGSVPYSREERPESSAYREIELCDIFVTIVGGRFGSEAQDNQGYSITQTEIQKAVERGIQVYIFVESQVLHEYSTYQLNKNNPKTKYRFVDDVRVYEFIETLYALPKNNPIAPFQTAADVTAYLLDQWSGLFQRFLQQQQRTHELHVLSEMKAIASTLREMVTFLTEEKQSGNEAIKTILLVNHPIFRRLAELTKTPYRVFFSNSAEMAKWLKARNWEETPPELGGVEEWSNEKMGTLIFKTKLFDEQGALRIFTESDWSDDSIILLKPDKKSKPFDDDIPF